ncbi:MAG: response regulator transcription factor [Nitrosomonadales bacterium]|nr:response regulator transcription factor [Nitrosomonadales bacterium]
MKILLADDHALFREGMHHVMHQLDEDGDLGEQVEILDACNFPEALAIAEKNPDICLALLDLMMPGSEGGVPAIRYFHSRHPDIVIVVLSGANQREEIMGAMNGGAMGFISKSSSSKEMVQALRVILDGGTYLPPQLLQQATNAGDGRTAWRNNKFGLTGRQLEVLQYIGRGLTNKSIAEVIGLSQGTVKIHVSAVFHILQVNNRIDAVRAGRRLGLLESEEAS